MKNRVYSLFIGIFCIISVSIVLSSCSAYDEDMMSIVEKDDNNDNTSTETENSDGIKNYTIIEKTFGLINGKYIAEIVVSATTYAGETKTLTFSVELPFEYTLGGDEYTTTTDAKASTFASLNAADTSSTSFVKNADGNYVRKISRNQVVKFSKFNRIFTSSHCEAYRFIGGKKEAFLTSTEVVSYKGLDQSMSKITVDTTTYERESNLVSMQVIFNKQTFTASATTFVDRELPKAKDETETMPDADFVIDDLTGFISWTKVYNNNKFQDGILLESSSKYYMLVDGAMTSIDKSAIAASTKYNSMVYDNGSYIPAILSVDGSGWTYVGQHVDGSVIKQSMYDQLAINKGIKNYSETNSAKPTPSVKNSVDVKSYNGKMFITIYGYTVDGKLNKAYTVAEK